MKEKNGERKNSNVLGGLIMRVWLDKLGRMVKEKLIHKCLTNQVGEGWGA